MPVAAKRAPVWLNTLGDWAWPGAPQASETLPPPWVPTLPPRLPAPATSPAAAAAAAPRTAVPRRIVLAGALSALATVLAVLALGAPHGLERLIAGHATAGAAVPLAADSSAGLPATPLPPLVHLSGGEGASAIDRASFP